jgi:RNA polymerase sigma-70 factor (ECF subfamily)
MCGIAGQDYELVQQILAGDNKAYWLLIERTKDLVFKVCNTELLTKPKTSLFSRQKVDDTARDIFIHAYNNLKNFKGESKFSTWLYSVASHYCINIRKKAEKEKECILEFDAGRDRTLATEQNFSDTILDDLHEGGISDDCSVGFDATEQCVEGMLEEITPSDQPDAFQKCVRSKIAMLDEKHSAVINLVHFAAHSYEQAARVLKCPIGTIRSRLSRAVEKLEPLVRECLALRRG